MRTMTAPSGRVALGTDSLDGKLPDFSVHLDQVLLPLPNLKDVPPQNGLGSGVLRVGRNSLPGLKVGPSVAVPMHMWYTSVGSFFFG